MRTCQRLGIETVAVYSEADAQALHVDMADEAFFVGPSPASQSYLDSHEIITVALKSGVEAIHPGYGFLSESADFARAVEAAGLVFIGPRPDVIRMMGDKLEAKAIARTANISLLPGSNAPVTTAEEVKILGNDLGYPILLKAAAGGGGKGMRIISDPSQIDDGLERTIHEALSSFGDGRVFVEKYIEVPRHIEIQILGDHHGNIVHLGERDCSLQRRHQKVIEESPSPFMTPELREAMTTQAVALARQVGYSSAGTIEFVVARDQNFYFLEMNTRLQVEHPVTEMITGIDLVEQMIRISADETLPFTQSQISFSGHAVEARLYAEDAEQDFMPCSGRITRFDLPLKENLRLDTGVEAGSDISIYYDPMIAKLISWAPKRNQAIDQLQQALATIIIEGPTHNAGFLERLLLHSKVKGGDFTTAFIQEEMTPGLPIAPKGLIPAIAASIHHQAYTENPSEEWVIVDNGEGTFTSLKDGAVQVEGTPFDLDLQWSARERRFTAKSKEQSYYGQVRLTTMGLNLSLLGTQHRLQVMTPKVWDLYTHVRPPEKAPENLTVTAPMPGILISLPITVGDRVKSGQTLLVIEAMKMENALKSPAEAIVMEIYVTPGETLTRNQLLVTLG
jgi:propionyl-CoA carboxylase alpha chain